MPNLRWLSMPLSDRYRCRTIARFQQLFRNTKRSIPSTLSIAAPSCSGVTDARWADRHPRRKEAMRCARGSDVVRATTEIRATQNAIRARRIAPRGDTTIFLVISPRTRKTLPMACVFIAVCPVPGWMLPLAPLLEAGASAIGHLEERRGLEDVDRL